MTHYDLIIPVLTGLAVICVGGAILLIQAARRQPIRQRLDEFTRQGDEFASKPKGSGLVGVVSDLGQKASSGRMSTLLRQTLTQAGYHDPSAAAVYIGAKIVLLCLGLLAAASIELWLDLPTQMRVMLPFSLGGIAFFVPNMIVSSRRSRRRSEVRAHLPDAIDLLEICVSAGMGLDMAWNSVGDEVRSVSYVLADEMALTNLEIHLGADRAQAMRHMAQRTGAQELSSLVAVFVQSERFGTPLTDVLRTFAGSMRETRSQTAQEAAEKMAVKLIFPMVGCIFPSVLMVMAGPAFLSLHKALMR